MEGSGVGVPRDKVGKLGMPVLNELLGLGCLASKGSEGDEGRWGRILREVHCCSSALAPAI